MVELAKPKTSTDQTAQCMIAALAKCSGWTHWLRDASIRPVRWLRHDKNRRWIPESGKEDLKVQQDAPEDSAVAERLGIIVISYGRSRGRSVLDKADIRAENLGTAARPDGTGQALRLGRAE